METIIVLTSEHIAQALKDEGLTPFPVPENAFWTATTREGTVRFVVLDRLMQRAADKINSADIDQCEYLVEALIQFVEALIRFVEKESK